MRIRQVLYAHDLCGESSDPPLSDETSIVSWLSNEIMHMHKRYDRNSTSPLNSIQATRKKILPNSILITPTVAQLLAPSHLPRNLLTSNIRFPQVLPNMFPLPLIILLNQRLQPNFLTSTFEIRRGKIPLHRRSLRPWI